MKIIQVLNLTPIGLRTAGMTIQAQFNDIAPPPLAQRPVAARRPSLHRLQASMARLRALLCTSPAKWTGLFPYRGSHPAGFAVQKLGLKSDSDGGILRQAISQCAPRPMTRRRERREALARIRCILSNPTPLHNPGHQTAPISAQADLPGQGTSGGGVRASRISSFLPDAMTGMPRASAALRQFVRQIRMPEKIQHQVRLKGFRRYSSGSSTMGGTAVSMEITSSRKEPPPNLRMPSILDCPLPFC